MASEINSNLARNPEIEEVGVEEMNQPSEMSIGEIQKATAMVNQNRATLVRKLEDMDTELEKCEAEMGDSSDNGEEEEPHALLNWKKTILKKKELYNRHINALDDYSIKLEEASMSLEEAKIKSLVESIQRNVKRKVDRESRSS